MDIESTRWCPHGKRYDDYCFECEEESENAKLADEWAETNNQE